MCVAFFSYDWHPYLLLMIAFNRDEYFSRPTEPSHFWPDHPTVLGGRDIVRNGTWFGITTNGRIAFLTNFREILSSKQQTSRGALTTDFLYGNSSPSSYLQDLQGDMYSGFNLVVGDLTQPSLAFYSNRGSPGNQTLDKGIYGVSNGPFMLGPKVQSGVARLSNILEGYASADPAQFPWTRVFDDLLSDAVKVSDRSLLPITGLDPELEYNLSSIFIPETETPAGLYGTRSQSVLAVWRNGRAEYHERFVDGSKVWQHVKHHFEVPTCHTDYQSNHDEL